MARPLISVIMPTHNYGRFINDAINSFLGQSYPHFELIIVDDASTDNTLEIVGQYKDTRLNLISRPECSCSAEVPRNDGLAIAKGDLIAVADADDISLPYRLEQQVTFLATHSEVDLLGGGMIKTDESGNPVSDLISMPVFQDPRAYRDRLLSGKIAIVHGTLMFRRHVLDKVPAYNDYASGADTEFMLRASRYFGVHNLKEALIYYRQHEHSVSHTIGRRLNRYYKKITIVREQYWIEKELQRLEHSIKI